MILSTTFLVFLMNYCLGQVCAHHESYRFKVTCKFAPFLNCVMVIFCLFSMSNSTSASVLTLFYTFLFEKQKACVCRWRTPVMHVDGTDPG